MPALLLTLNRIGNNTKEVINETNLNASQLVCSKVSCKHQLKGLLVFCRTAVNKIIEIFKTQMHCGSRWLAGI